MRCGGEDEKAIFQCYQLRCMRCTGYATDYVCPMLATRRGVKVQK